MDILKILTDFIVKDGNNSVLEPIVNLLAENSFDIKKTVANLSPEKIAPIIENFINYEQKSETYSGQNYGVSPISDIADKDIVYTLNKYLGG